VPKHEQSNEEYSLRLLHVMLKVVTRIGYEGTKDTCGYANVVSMQIQRNLAIAQRCQRIFNVRAIAMRISTPHLQTLRYIRKCLLIDEKEKNSVNAQGLAYGCSADRLSGESHPAVEYLFWKLTWWYGWLQSRRF
jgi:hypothetical protein